MAITNDDLERVRHQLELKINSVSVEHVHLVQAIGSYGERFTAVDHRLDRVDRRLDGIDQRIDALSADMDRRFDALSADMDRRLGTMSDDIDRRFAGMDRRFDDVRNDSARLDRRIDRLDDKLDARFNVQTFLMAVLGVLVLFGDTIRELIGI